MMPFRHKELRGWTYIGRTIMPRLEEDIQKAIPKMDDFFIKKYSRMTIRYVNSGNVTASSKIPVIDLYRRLNGKRGCLICGFVAKDGEATKHMKKKHPELYGKMDYLADYYNIGKSSINQKQTKEQTK